MDASVSRELRRRILACAAGAGALSLLRPLRVVAGQVGSSAALGFTELSEGTLEEQRLYALSGKVPLIKKTYRPPNFETPIDYLRTPITSNAAFFVRWHLAGIGAVKASDWRLSVGGESAQRPFELTLEQLKRDFDHAEITAVCQCAGNRRGLFDPHVGGVQWGVGAMGNAVWRGVRLRDILARAGMTSDALEVAFGAADRPVLDKTPAFVKSLPMSIALDDNTLVAFEMNGAPLPHWNGFPARLVVPGWTATYWVKQLSSISVISKPETNFWMSTAYRLPRGMFKTPTFASQASGATEPITTIVVNSLITSLRSGQQLPRNTPIQVRGMAWDGGSGIAGVDVSIDMGASWQAARLGRDMGRFSWREFSFVVPPRERGSIVVMARAANRLGETQPERLIHNPAGYHHNVIQRVYVEVV